MKRVVKRRRRIPVYVISGTNRAGERVRRALTFAVKGETKLIPFAHLLMHQDPALVSVAWTERAEAQPGLWSTIVGLVQVAIPGARVRRNRPT